MTNSFASFFNELYYTKDHAYRRFHLLREWRPFHIYKRPLVFDATDGKYLDQFPRKFWLQAMVKRYRADLFEALKDRWDRRQPIYQKKHDEILPQLLEQWKNKKNGEKLARRKAVLMAEEYAAAHENGGIEYPEEKRYTFKGAGKGGAVTVVAHTYMKQLVHKLEGDFGDPNGFDLSHPRTNGTHMSCRGFNFPTQDTIREMLSDWMNYIAHHMLGKLPEESEEIKWRADHTGGSGKAKFDDTFTVNRVKEERYKYWKERLPTEENVLKLWQEVLPNKKPGANSKEIRDNNSKMEQLARALAERDIKKMAGDGRIKTPPTPHHPEGRTVGLDDDGDVKHPSLYMPHKKVHIRYIDEDGHEQKASEEVPYLLPGNFLRKLTPSEAESMPDDSKVGKHWNHDSQRFESQYVPVTDHPAPGAQGTGHILAGALQPQHNTTGRKFLDPSHDEYDSKLEQLNREIGLRPDGQSSEIYDAIEQALEASNVGGMGNYERQVLTLMKKDLHNLAYLLFMENLDEDDKHIFSVEWRKRKVRDMVAKYGQQDWGRGTRRLRGSKETNSLDSEVPGEDGDETMTLADKLGNQLNKAKAQALALRDSGKCKVGPGGKKLKTGECEFEYDLRQLHAILDSAEQEAAQADTEIERGEDAIDGDTMSAGVQSKLDATFRAFSVLKAHFINIGEPEGAAEKAAMAALGEINSDDPPAKTLISRVRRRIDKMAQGAGVEKAKLPTIDKKADAATDDEAIQKAASNLTQVEEILQRLLDAGNIEKYMQRVNDPNFASAMSQLMVKYPSLKQRYERLLQQAKDVKRQIATPVPPTPAASPQARQATNAANRMDLKKMLDDDRLDLIPFNTQFRRLVGEGRISIAKVKEMLGHLKERQGGLFAHPGDQEAIAAFEELKAGK